MPTFIFLVIFAVIGHFISKRVDRSIDATLEAIHSDFDSLGITFERVADSIKHNIEDFKKNNNHTKRNKNTK